MPTVVTIHKEVEAIKLRVMPKRRTALVWDNSDVSFVCDNQHFDNKKQFKAYLDSAGYSCAIHLGWMQYHG